jgi:hypothetical protein
MFERYVTGKQGSWRRRALVVGSLVLHGGVVAALMIASWFRVAELTPPMLAIAFIPQPPPQGAAVQKPKTPAHVATHHPRTAVPTLTQPSPRVEPADEPPSDGPPSPTDRPPGPPGPPGPPSTCTGPGCTAVNAPAPRPRNVPPHALDAQRIGGAIPHLPASVIGSRRGLGDSTFTARLCVDTSGTISSVTVLAGIPGADADIVSTLRGWRYKPQPIPVCFVTQLVYDVQ